MENYNSQSTQFDLSFEKYIKRSPISIFSKDNVIGKDNIEDLICPICFYVLKNPISCSSNKNAHSFCKECIDHYLNENDNDKCPICKLKFEYKNNNELIDSLNKLSFECFFKKEGCKDILSYSEYLNHINICKYNNNIQYKCNIKKYNYNKKEFEICGYIGNKIKIEQHFKKCGLIKFNCLFCNKFFLQMDIEEHVTNKCKIIFEKYANGDKYFGEKSNNLKEGYGIYFYSNGGEYEGQFKNDMKEGFGIDNTNEDYYIGEFKKGLREGYGIVYYSEEIRYEGEFKNDKKEGYGIDYYSNGDRYEGEFKNNKKRRIWF